MTPADFATATAATSNDYHQIPVTDRQIRYARQIAQGTGRTLPREVQSDRRALSNWIDEHRAILAKSRFSNYPTSRQVAFAERIARQKRREVPPECFRDKTLMSRWIDANM